MHCSREKALQHRQRANQVRGRLVAPTCGDVAFGILLASLSSCSFRASSSASAVASWPFSSCASATSLLRGAQTTQREHSTHSD